MQREAEEEMGKGTAGYGMFMEVEHVPITLLKNVCVEIHQGMMLWMLHFVDSEL